MIVVVYTSNPVHNELLLYQAEDLTFNRYTFFMRAKSEIARFHTRGDMVTSEDRSKPISRLKPDEPLYVVGHGDRDNPTLSELTPEQLANLLQSLGLNPRVKRLKIHLICCHSGHKADWFKLSFAEQLYWSLVNEIHEIDRHHMEAEGSLPSVIAPKHVIGFRRLDGRAIGIKPKDYLTYQQTKEESPDQLDKWLNDNASELERTDFQVV